MTDFEFHLPVAAIFPAVATNTGMIKISEITFFICVFVAIKTTATHARMIKGIALSKKAAQYPIAPLT